MIGLAWPLSLASEGFFFFLSSLAVPPGSSSQDSLGTPSSSHLVPLPCTSCHDAHPYHKYFTAFQQMKFDCSYHKSSLFLLWFDSNHNLSLWGFVLFIYILTLVLMVRMLAWVYIILALFVAMMSWGLIITNSTKGIIRIEKLLDLVTY